MSEEQQWTTLKFDSQIFSAFMACPREMDLRFNKHYVPIGGPSPSLNKGLLAHHGLAAYYKSMKDGNPSSINHLKAREAMKEYSPTLDMNGEDVVLVHKTFDQYVEFRKNDIFIVVFTERLFSFVAYEQYPIRVILTGRIDLGITEYGAPEQIIPIDHKSESEQWFYSALNNQFKIYGLACNSNKLVVNRFGFQTSVKPEIKFKREDIILDRATQEEFKNEVIPYYAKQMLIAYEDGYFPPNYSNCNKGHWGCIFSDKYNKGICNIDPSLRAQKLRLYFREEEWKPEAGSNE